MADLIAALKAFSALFPHPYKLMIALVILAGFGLFLPATWQRRVGVWDFTHAHPVLLWVLFAGSLIILLLSLGEWVWKKDSKNTRLKTRLESLSGAERNTLVALLKGETIFARPHEAGVIHLYKDGILWMDNSHFTGGECTYGIDADTRSYLKKIKFGQ